MNVRFTIHRFLVLLLACMSCGAEPIIGEDFLQFRGADGRNVFAEGKAPTEWSVEKNLAWKVKLPGRAVNGVIVVGGQVIATSSSGHANDRLHVYSIDEQSGKSRWSRTIYSTGRAFCHPLSSMAAPTPASDGKSIFALFSTNDLVCLDLQGNLQWVRSLGMDFPGAFDDRGLASSPIVIDGTVVIQVACQGDSFVLGVDAVTGQDRWRKDLPRTTAWSSPTPVNVDGRRFVLVHSASDFQAIDPTTGESKWMLVARGALIPSPAVSDKSVFLASAGLTRIDLDLNVSTPEKIWSKQKLSAGSASPIVAGDRIFVIHASNILTCGETKEGEVTWQVRLKGTKTWATPLLVGKHVYVVNDAGLTQVVDVLGAEGEIVSENDLGEEMLGSPAYANGALFLRGVTHVFKVAE
ncbi:MAG: PQQ-binding-like beta-propeller repeat protein [Planctomycetaceae bacterium]|nr:PQQ-binding-like beta-propeller repeat protein [Planctomycetaceae bacterium]